MNDGLLDEVHGLGVLKLGEDFEYTTSSLRFPVLMLRHQYRKPIIERDIVLTLTGHLHSPFSRNCIAIFSKLKKHWYDTLSGLKKQQDICYSFIKPYVAFKSCNVHAA